MDAQALLRIATEYVEAGRDIEDASVVGLEIADGRPALANEWAAAMTSFVDARVQEHLSKLAAEK